MTFRLWRCFNIFRETAKPDTNLAQTAVLNQVAQTEQVSTVAQQLKLKFHQNDTAAKGTRVVQ